ncbi:MAG TPA: hypothetical protein VGW58_19470 [Pyrinomonadaceae bacterium]|nr:hypothetical protein [Pyrinomonadaceae bacterium]
MKSKLDDDIDALFRLPLGEFTGARNTLAARLKKEGRANDAERVKLLSKPSISAWTANQLYWEHRDEFDELMATGKRLRPVQTPRTAAKVAGMRDSLDARREVLSRLSDLAETLLQDAGHSPTPDTLHRITTTLEALSASSSDGPTPGRLTQDLDPPSFEALASLMGAGGGATKESGEPARVTPSRKSLSLVVPPARQKTTAADDERKIRQAKIAAAKMSLLDAKKALTEARTKAQSLEAAQKKANLEAKESEKQRREAEKQKREAEQRLEKATAASEAAARRAEDVAAEADNAAQAFEDAKRSIDEATKDLESLLRES